MVFDKLKPVRLELDFIVKDLNRFLNKDAVLPVISTKDIVHKDWRFYIMLCFDMIEPSWLSIIFVGDQLPYQLQGHQFHLKMYIQHQNDNFTYHLRS